jgi:K+-transporting ATPase A subunit
MTVILMILAAAAGLACFLLAVISLCENIERKLPEGTDDLTGLLISIGALLVPISILSAIWMVLL